MDVIESLSKTEKGKLHYDRQCMTSPNVKKLLQTIHDQSSERIVVPDSTISSISTKCERTDSAETVGTDVTQMPATIIDDSSSVTNSHESSVTHQLVDKLIHTALSSHQKDARYSAVERVSMFARQLSQLRAQHVQRCRQLLMSEQLLQHQLQQKNEQEEQLVSSRMEQCLAVTEQQKQLDSQEVMNRAAAIQQKQRQLSRQQSELLSAFVSNQQQFRSTAKRVIDLMKECESLSEYITGDVVTTSGRELKSHMVEMDKIASNLNEPCAIERSSEILKAVECLTETLQTAIVVAKQTKNTKSLSSEAGTVSKQDASIVASGTPTILETPPTRPEAPQVTLFGTPTQSQATPPEIDQPGINHSPCVAPSLSPTKTVLYVFDDDLKRFNQLKADLEALQRNFAPFLADASMKSCRATYLKAINTRLNSLGQHNLSANVAALNSILSGELPSTTTAPSIGGKPQLSQPAAVDYCVDLLARMFVRQGEDVVSAGSTATAGGLQSQHQEHLSASAVAAGRLAQLMTPLWTRHVRLAAAVMAYFYQRCPYLLPLTPRRYDNESEPDFLRRCGYQVSSAGAAGAGDGYKLEAQQLFLRRMSGAARLYATLLCAKIASPTDNTGASHTSGDFTAPGIHTLWLWLVSVVGIVPFPGVSASVMEAILDTAHCQLRAVYGRQFVKMCHLIRQQYLPRLAQVTDEGGRGPLLRLEQLLTTITNSPS